jgi:hypothetical protein
MTGHFWYKGIKDEKYVRVIVLRYAKKGKIVELIRNDNSKIKRFWVNTDELRMESNNPL